MVALMTNVFDGAALVEGCCRNPTSKSNELRCSRALITRFRCRIKPLARLQRADAGLRAERETPVEQAGGLIPIRRAARFHQPVHHGDHQPAARPRAAAPTNVLRAASVKPVLPPMAPG